MRICLDISAALGQGAGIGRYARELALEMHHLTGGPDLVLFHNRQPLSRLPTELSDLPRIEIPLGNWLWRLFLMSGLRLPPTWRKSITRCDLFHGTDSLAPHISQPTVLTIHDLSTTLYPQHHTLFHRLYTRIALPTTIRRAKVIIADSQATRHDVIEYLHTPAEKVKVVYLGVDHTRFYPRDATQSQQKVKQLLGVGAPYILAVGTLEPRKNLLTLLRAYAQLGADCPTLVLVGAQGWGDNPLTQVARELGIQERVRLTGYVTESLLPDLYAGAECFVYPSLYEGFGLPVLEAMACGTPTISSSVSSLPEVASNAAILVDPRSVEGLADHMRELLADANLRTHLSEAGPRQAAQFSWEQCARQTIEIYHSVLNQ